MGEPPLSMATGEPVETGVLHRQDNLEQLAEFPSDSVDLIYLDPPFFSNRFYEVIWGEEAEVRSFEDRWEGGIQHYISWMRDRAIELHRVLKPTGSLYLHCDPHASHHLKVMLDQVFGDNRFRNEVIWKRTSAHSSAKRWGPVHDTILYYGKGSQVTWNAPRTDYDPGYLSRYYKYHDGDGRLYWRADLTGAGTRQGATGKPWRGLDPTRKGRHWMVPPDELDALDAQGLIYWPPGGTGWPQHKRFRDDLKGRPIDDIWTDIDRINPKARERLGYPTQKPEALLARIVQASSTEGDVVLDPFCGCGTTIAVAQQFQRRWIGIDISATAIEVMRRRLAKLGCAPKIGNAVDSVAALKVLKPFEFQNWVVNAVNGTHSPKHVGDMGIDGYWFFTGEPIQVKQSENVGRPVVDNFQTAVRRAGHTMGYIIAFSFTRGAHEEAARAKAEENIEIRLIKVAEVLLLVKRPHGKFGPQPGSVEELPLVHIRKPKEMPSADELIASDRQSVG